jgi:hypothetical protein
MKTREILPPEWKPFFDRFSRAHQGMRATVETLDLDLGVQPNARNLPLVGVAVEGGEDDRRIEVIVGESPRAHFTHVIDQPLRVRVAEWNDGFSSAVQVETSDGRTTLLRIGPQDRVLSEGLITDGTQASRT